MHCAAPAGAGHTRRQTNPTPIFNTAASLSELHSWQGDLDKRIDASWPTWTATKTREESSGVQG